MSSDFDRLMRRADDSLFRVFGEDRCQGKPTYTPPGGAQQCCEVMLGRDVVVTGADGMFRSVKIVASLRTHQVSGKRGGLLELAEGRFKLDDFIDTDGLVERWSVLEVT
ncbi:hypothetical protein DFO61_3352 [Ectopseudomonas oleovorans]|uniref:Uncharacterized protein n=1 Tax=Ectopseudomonas oleovorans TaxID=301 RepID=A0A397MCA9_ECTOL|nr:hypothetical protein [Pseudomonas oleovorans]RIA22662.1 hypothetical protein DFO61_3352 [Pseudomonas oleovorans]